MSESLQGGEDVSTETLIKKFQERIEYENHIFHSRTSIFLATNGLLAAAVGLGNETFLLIGTEVLGALVSLMWWRCSLQSLAVLASLTGRYIYFLKDPETDDYFQFPDDPEKATEHVQNAHIEQIVQLALGKRWHHNLRPNTLLARYLPVLFLVFWIIILVWQIVVSVGEII
jgi:hypothetical protein